MRADLDRLMEERDMNALIVLIDEKYSPVLDYLAGQVKMSHGLAVKPCGAAPTLIAGPMETEEAKVSGLDVLSYHDVGYAEALEAIDSNGTSEDVLAIMWGNALKKLGVEAGRISVYGMGDASSILAIVDSLQTKWTEYTFVGEGSASIFRDASATKDAAEIKRIKVVARHTSDVLAETWNFISQHYDKDGTVVDQAGTPLTIGRVKQFVRDQLARRGLEADEMIFAQGRDGGFPHSRGQTDMALRTGEAIVFDLFPFERGGGYHHDVTRTWCIGHAPENVQQIYQTVREAYDISIETYGLNKPTYLMQEAVLDYFERQGHPTSRSDPSTTVGYVHSLGHGIGLNIHEGPNISHLRKKDTFQVGQVITIEPGLYYPDEGFGVRYENAVLVAEDGSLQTLTDFHDKLVIPIKPWAEA